MSGKYPGGQAEGESSCGGGEMKAVGAGAVSFLRAGDGPQRLTLGGPGADGAGEVVCISFERLASEKGSCPTGLPSSSLNTTGCSFCLRCSSFCAQAASSFSSPRTWLRYHDRPPNVYCHIPSPEDRAGWIMNLSCSSFYGQEKKFRELKKLP